MKQYINKTALVAEIMSRINNIEVSQKAGLIKKRDANKKILLFKSILSLIDTIEVKEVDSLTDIVIEKARKWFQKSEHLDFNGIRRYGKDDFEDFENYMRGGGE